MHSVGFPVALPRRDGAIAHPAMFTFELPSKTWEFPKAPQFVNIMKWPPVMTQLDEVLRKGA